MIFIAPSSRGAERCIVRFPCGRRGADMMNMTRASHRGSVDGNGQVRRVDQRRLVPIGVRRRGQTTAKKLSRPRGSSISGQKRPG